MEAHPHIHDQLRMTQDEHLVLLARKHVFIFFKDLLGVVVATIVPFAVLVVFGTFVSNVSLALFVTAVWLLVVWMFVFTVWTNYYLDIWIVTNKRIVDIDQIRLFRRDVSTLRIESIQDIRVEKHGFLQEVFNYGSLYVQSAGAEKRFLVIDGVRNPNFVRNTILYEVDKSLGIESKHPQSDTAH